METCTNCHTKIGDLETPCIWRERVVCAACHRRLVGSAESSDADPTSGTTGGPTALEALGRTAAERAHAASYVTAAAVAPKPTVYVSVARSPRDGFQITLGILAFVLAGVSLITAAIWVPILSGIAVYAAVVAAILGAAGIVVATARTRGFAVPVVGLLVAAGAIGWLERGAIARRFQQGSGPAWLGKVLWARHGTAEGQAWIGNSPLRGATVYLLPRQDLEDAANVFCGMLPHLLITTRARLAALRVKVVQTKREVAVAMAAYNKALAEARQAFAAQNKAVITNGPDYQSDVNAATSISNKAQNAEFREQSAYLAAQGRVRSTAYKIHAAKNTLKALDALEQFQRATDTAQKHPAGLLAAALNSAAANYARRALLKVVAMKLRATANTTTDYQGKFSFDHARVGRYYVLCAETLTLAEGQVAANAIWLLPVSITSGVAHVNLSENDVFMKHKARFLENQQAMQSPDWP